jgi:hypothetical protein
MEKETVRLRYKRSSVLCRSDAIIKNCNLGFDPFLSNRIQFEKYKQT